MLNLQLVSIILYLGIPELTSIYNAIEIEYLCLFQIKICYWWDVKRFSPT